MESVIFYSIARILARVDLNMSLSGVEDMGHSNAFEIVYVADGVSIAKDDAIKHLQLVNQY